MYFRMSDEPSKVKGRPPTDSSEESDQEPSGSIQCAACKKDHRIVDCALFKNFKLEHRRKVVERRRLCENCLGNHDPTSIHCRNDTCGINGCTEFHHALLHEERPGCPACSGEHQIAFCPIYLRLSVGKRMRLVQHHGLCNNCLESLHVTAESVEHCRQQFCPYEGCQKRHHPSLHPTSKEAVNPREQLTVQTGTSGTKSGSKAPRLRPGMPPRAPGMRTLDSFEGSSSSVGSTGFRFGVLPTIYSDTRKNSPLKGKKSATITRETEGNGKNKVSRPINRDPYGDPSDEGSEKCRICFLPQHINLSFCGVFRASPILVREQYIKDLRACIRCLGIDHTIHDIENCSEHQESICGERGCLLSHHHLLHRIPYVRKDTKGVNQRAHDEAMRQHKLRKDTEDLRLRCGFCKQLGHDTTACKKWGEPRLREVQARRALCCVRCLGPGVENHSCPCPESICGIFGCKENHHQFFHQWTDPIEEGRNIRAEQNLGEVRWEPNEVIDIEALGVKVEVQNILRWNQEKQEEYVIIHRRDLLNMVIKIADNGRNLLLRNDELLPTVENILRKLPSDQLIELSNRFLMNHVRQHGSFDRIKTRAPGEDDSTYLIRLALARMYGFIDR